MQYKDCFFSGPRIVGRNLQTYILTPNHSNKRSKVANLKFSSAETFLFSFQAKRYLTAA